MDPRTVDVSFLLGRDDVHNTSSFVGEVNNSDYLSAYSEEDKERLTEYHSIAICISVVIVLSNVVVVISSGLILKKGQQPKSTYLLLGNVSLADMFLGMALLFGSALNISSNNTRVCATLLGSLVCPVIVSMQSVGLIAVDRYIYIVHGLYYQRWVTTRRVRLIILAAWFIGIILAFLPVMGWAKDTIKDRKCWHADVAPKGLIVLAATVCSIPLIIVIILYSIILYKAVKEISQIRKSKQQHTTNKPVNGAQTQIKSSVSFIDMGKVDMNTPTMEELPPWHSMPNLQCNGDRTTKSVKSSDHADLNKNDIDESVLSIETIQASENSISEAGANDEKPQKRCKSKSQKTAKPNKCRAITVVMLTSGSFVMTWLPFFIVTIISLRCDMITEKQRCLRIQVFWINPMAMLGMCNSVLNPLIYAWWHRGFKRSVKRIFHAYFKRNT